MLSMLLAGVAGAGLAYFLDPDAGRRRRSQARDRLLAALRHGSNQLARAGRGTAGQVYGVVQELAPAPAEEQPALNDPALVQKVESQVFADPSVPKGRINVNAENGVIVLRGEVERLEQISAIEEGVQKVPGVGEVKNLLHMPNPAAPTETDTPGRAFL